jgi:phosphatidylserine/phosphatidylglycerophosphate/cardiolipin synthase-like enzyme
MPSRRAKRSQGQTIITYIVIAIIVIIGAIEALQNPESSGSQTTGPAPISTLQATSVQEQQATNQTSVEIPNWVTVYFTNPNPPDNVSDGIDRYVVPVIDQATQTIAVTSFDLNLPSVVNALTNAAKRGVKVQVVYDGTNGSHELDNDLTNNKSYDAVKVLKSAKVKLVDGGRSNGLMHDKMIIVDGKTLFMGSWNMSYNDTFRNNNNLLKITDPQIIANYQAKFDEMFTSKLFGANAVVGAQTKSMNVEGVPVENFFSPPDGVMDKLIGYVQNAQKSVHFMAFTYTDHNLAQAMIERAKAGVDVQGVIENRGATQGALVDLFCAGLPVKTDGNKYTMHHKVIIIDDETVITGSFNFTKSADDANDDNVLVIHSPAIAALYENEFQKIDQAGVKPDSGEISCQ